MLTDLGVASDSALSGKYAINLIKERIKAVEASNANMYKILLLDYSMPEMDGPMVATRIRDLF